MRLRRATVTLIFVICLVSAGYAQGSLTTEGGNITMVELNASQLTEYWAGIVGWMGGGIVNITGPVSTRNATNNTIYTNYPNGTYAEYFNITMIITRLAERPDPAYIVTPNETDFNQTGMFSNFSAFIGVNYSTILDDPFDTFCNPCSYTTCYLYETPIICPYILLNPNTPMAVLKFFNGTAVEPLFVGVIENLPGYNTSNFDFEYIVPVREYYYFYLYKQKDCNVTVWIDDVQTTVFPKTGVPYKVEVLVRDNATLAPIPNATVRSIEGNGRNILYPIIELGEKFLGLGETHTNATGRVIFALEPTRYNIPDGYGYEAYIEVDGDYYCRENLSIASYGSLSPTYRSSLVNAAYASQVKASAQNMNSLASTATKWITARKMRAANVIVYTNGSYSALPTLKAGAPNKLNITAYDNDTGNEINATVAFVESNGLIVFVPLQPDKDWYNNSRTYYTNETQMVIPTGYNNNANITVVLSINGTVFATLPFTVDSVLEPPGGGETDMDDATYIQVSPGLQNINSVLMNIGKSLSTV